MRKLLVLFFLIFTANTIFSQDLIVTNEGDSINCKITKVKTDNIYFTFKYKNEIRSTLLPLLQIKTHKFNYYAISEVPKGKSVGYENYQHFRLAVSGGYSYQLGQIAESVPYDFVNYTKELKSGYHYGADLTYFFTEPLGFGLKYYLFKTSNSIDNIYIEDLAGNRKYGSMSDDLSISFIGPTFTTRILNHNKKNAFLVNIAFGYMGYNNDKVIIEKYKMTGNSVGLAFEMGYDIELSESLALGFQLSIITGNLFEYQWDDGITKETIKLEKGEFESLSRIDLSVGLRFGK